MNISPVPFRQSPYGRFLNDHSRKIKHSPKKKKKKKKKKKSQKKKKKKKKKKKS